MIWPLAIFLSGVAFALRRTKEESASSAATAFGFDRFTRLPQPGGSSSSSSNGRALANALPAAIPARDAAIFALAQSGAVPAPALLPVTYTKDGHTVLIEAADDALKLGTEDPIRLTVTHATAQRLADLFGAMLPTSRMADAAFLNAIQLAPQTLPTQGMSSTAQMIHASDLVSNEAVKRGGRRGTLLRDVGKDWVNSERLLTPDGHMASPVGQPGAIAAANFGWHLAGAGSRSPGGLPVIQSIGLAHDIGHTDYSQVVTLYGPAAIIDGIPVRIADALRDPATAYLLSDEVAKGQPARVVRHPAIPAPPLAPGANV